MDVPSRGTRYESQAAFDLIVNFFGRRHLARRFRVELDELENEGRQEDSATASLKVRINSGFCTDCGQVE
jgi:hypothetical protein